MSDVMENNLKRRINPPGYDRRRECEMGQWCPHGKHRPDEDEVGEIMERRLREIDKRHGLTWVGDVPVMAKTKGATHV